MRYFLLLSIVVLLGSQMVNAQDAVLSDVHLFQTFLRDAPISKNIYAEGGLSYSDFDNASIFGIALQGGFPINPKIEIGANWGFLNFSPENGDGESGLSDLTVSGRYLIMPEKTNIAAGAFITLPVGKEEIGQSTTDFGAFGALRHPLNNGMVITGVIGLDFLEIKTGDDSDRETSLLVGGGLIYPATDQLHILGEFNLQTEGDFAMISGGVDYRLKMGSKIRGMLGLGLDDGAPDFMIMGSFLHFFR